MMCVSKRIFTLIFIASVLLPVGGIYSWEYPWSKNWETPTWDESWNWPIALVSATVLVGIAGMYIHDCNGRLATIEDRNQHIDALLQGAKQFEVSVGQRLDAQQKTMDCFLSIVARLQEASQKSDTRVEMLSSIAAVHQAHLKKTSN